MPIWCLFETLFLNVHFLHPALFWNSKSFLQDITIRPTETIVTKEMSAFQSFCDIPNQIVIKVSDHFKSGSDQIFKMIFV